MDPVTLAPMELVPLNPEGPGYPATVYEVIQRLLDMGDACQWKAAELITEQLDSGKTQREVAEGIGKSHVHVGRMAKAWRQYGPGNPGYQESLEFAEAYRLAKQPRKPKAIKGTVNPHPEVTETEVIEISEVSGEGSPERIQCQECATFNDSTALECSECGQALGSSTSELWEKYADEFSALLTKVTEDLVLDGPQVAQAKKYLKDMIDHKFGDRLHSREPFRPRF